MAKDLRKLYKKEFEEMYAAALENTREANEYRMASEHELQEARENLRNLKETAKKCKGNFVNDATELIKFGFGTNVILDSLKRIAENILQFVSSKEEIPEAEAEILEKEQIYGKAGAKFARCLTEERAIRGFVSETFEEANTHKQEK